jgi:hypothetical protein
LASTVLLRSSTAYATECALKGLWVRAGNRIIARGKFVGVPEAGDHELRQLAVAVAPVSALELSEDELNVLERLSRFIVFAGRSPVPKRPEEMKPKMGLGRIPQVPHFFSEADFDVTRQVLNRLTTALNPFLPDPKPHP